MFESAEIGHKLGKAQFRKEEPKLRQRLLDLQTKLGRQARFPVVVLVNGVDGAGKGESVNLLNEWMDSRNIHTYELWFHLSKKAQKKRLAELAGDKDTAWRVTAGDWKRFKRYDAFMDVCEDAIRATSSGEAPWYVIEGSDHEYRSLTAGRLLEDALKARLAGTKPVISPPAPPPPPPLDGRTLLAAHDYKRKLDRDAYGRKLVKLQRDLALLTRSKKMKDRSLVCVFEGMDAAGKGSTIRRITHALDARFYRVIPVAAPSEEERAQPYLWRFWRQIPGHGRAAIFDRSWYGRVLVERVEKFCSEFDWMRAYGEINDFEGELVDSGAIVCKFWLSVTSGEQLKRFKARQETPHKRFKITAEDWRNRKKWPQYERAVEDMLERTNTEPAPWDVVASDDKLFSRIEALEKLRARIEAAL